MKQYKSKLGILNEDAFVGKFEGPQDELEAKYGLPSEVKFCSKCVISNQRPNSAVEFQHTAASKKATINFDQEEICDACRMAEQKKAIINWEEREQQLIELMEWSAPPLKIIIQ